MSGSREVYEFLKDKVVWHDVEREPADYPKNSFPVIAEGFCFNGVARYGYNGWKREEGGGFICSVKRWAIIPHEIWLAYYHGYFDKFDKTRTFQTKEEFQSYSAKAIRIETVSEEFEYIGSFQEDRPYSFYSANIYYKDNQYYICDVCKTYAMD